MAKTPPTVWMRKNYAFSTELSRTVRYKPLSPADVLTSDKVVDNIDLSVAESEKQNKANVTCSRDESSWIMKQAELEAAFQISAETVVPTVELDPGNSVQIETYVNKAFEIPQQTKSDLWEKARNKLHSGLKLCGTIINARGIPAMDANGKSDPYCVVGIISESYRNDEKAKKGHLVKWKKGGLEVNVFKTTVKLATLEPQWNEYFELPIQKPGEEVLVIEVWDSDMDTVGVSEVKGVKGLAKFVKDLKKQDDFIGRGFHPLKGVPLTGASLTLDLCSHSAKRQYGTVSLYLSIRGKDEGDMPVTIKMDRYMLLFKALVTHEARQGSQNCQKNWNVEMSDSAKKLLHLHVSFYGISEIQQAIIHLSVLCAYHKTFGLQPSAFISALGYVIANQACLRTSPLRGDTAQPIGAAPSAPGDWVDKLLGALEGLLTEVYSVLCSHLILMDVTTTAGVESLTGWIQVMAKLYQLDDLVARLPVDRRSLKTALEGSIKMSVVRWYQSLYDMSRLKSILLQCYALKAVSEACQTLCSTIQDSISPAVKKLTGVDYLAIYLASLDTLFSPAVMELMERWNQKKELAVTTSYAMYLNIKSLCAVAKTTDLKGLQLTNCQRWFKKMVPMWLKVALVACKEKIDKAVEEDKIAIVTDEVCYSSSLVDTLTFLHQMMDFWNNLEWTSPEETYTFVVELINCITDAAKYYVEQIYTRAFEHTSGMEQFSITVKECIILNNMQHMRLVLSPESSQGVVGLLDELKLHKTFDFLQQEIGIGEQGRNLVGEVVRNAAEDIGYKIVCESEKLAMQFIPTIRVFIGEAVQAAQGLTIEQVLSPLGEYLNTNLKTLSSNLLFSVFRILLEDIWNATVDALSKSVSTLPKKPNQKYLYQRLRDSLDFLHGFFNAGGEGLTGEQLETEQYKVLLNDLDLMCLSTRELVLRCCADLAEQQAKVVGSSEQKYGELTLSVGYIKEMGNVEVTVFQGRNLPKCDKKFSDTYIRLVLLPEGYFQKDSRRSGTQIPSCRQASNSAFNHEFVLPASQESMEMKGTIAVLVAYNRDVLGKEIFIGMCVIPCNDIPRISNKSSLLDVSSPKRMNMALPLFHIGESKALQELTARQVLADPEATDFLSTLNKVCSRRSLTTLLSSSSLTSILNSAVQGAKSMISVP
ncbi:hypothetical protein EMCRGX_G027672 [Ephydatia muelleri]